MLEPLPNLLLWQPVIAGRQYLQQFLRIKLTGQLLDEQTPGRTGTAQLRERLRAGEAVEVAGYSISPGLGKGLDAADLAAPSAPTRIAWLEMAATTGAELTPASRGRVQAWQSAGHQVHARTVEGPAFWQTLEIVECPALVEATLAAVDEWRR